VYRQHAQIEKLFEQTSSPAGQEMGSLAQ